MSMQLCWRMREIPGGIFDFSVEITFDIKGKITFGISTRPVLRSQSYLELFSQLLLRPYVQLVVIRDVFSRIRERNTTILRWRNNKVGSRFTDLYQVVIPVRGILWPTQINFVCYSSFWHGQWRHLEASLLTLASEITLFFGVQ